MWLHINTHLTAESSRILKWVCDSNLVTFLLGMKVKFYSINGRAFEAQKATWQYQQQGLLIKNYFHILFNFFPFKWKENRLFGKEVEKGRSTIKLSTIDPVSNQQRLTM